MRKTSHDGGDSTSITSGVENEIKKSAMKPKKSSLKRKPPNFSQESDDTVIEPLLQKDKEKSEPQSAKYFGIGKTDSLQNKETDNKTKATATTAFCGTTESLLSFKDSESSKTTSVVAPLHNYMNTNVFNSHDNAKANVTTKSQILVEIESSKQSSYTPSPLIFTTAKIHNDAKTKQMEPVHVTTVPILSTVEVNITKEGNIISNERKISNGSSVINPVYSPMPLNKGKEEKVTLSSFTTATSPTMNKDAFSKTVTSAPKLANITTAQSSSIKITLPSTTSNSLLMKINTKDKQEDIKKDQMLPQSAQLQSKAFNLDNTKNNVTVKTMMSSSGKAIDNSTTSQAKSSQSDKSQIHKVCVGDTKSVNVSSSDSQHITSIDKTQTSLNSFGISNPAKTTSSSIGSKQLQRQKTTTEETSNMKSKTEPSIEHSENSSAKMSSHTKIDNISIKDGKVPNASANNMQNIHLKSSTNDTANVTSKTTSILTTTKPTVTSVASLNTVTPSTDVSHKPLTSNIISKADKIISPTTTSKNALSTVNKMSTASTISSTKPSAKDDAKICIPKTIVTAKSPEVTSIQTQPQTSTSKTLTEKTPVVSTAIAKPTVSVYSDKNKAASPTAKPVSAIPKATATSLTQLANSTSTATKIPVTTSVKATLASFTTGAGAKPSQTTPQVSSSTSPLTLGPVSAVKAPAVSSSIPKAMSSAVSPKAAASQNITSAGGTENKQVKPAVGLNATFKTPSAVAPEKSSSVDSSAPVAITAGVKSPNNNSSHILGASKPSTTSTPKTESVTTLSKSTAASSSTTFSVKSPKDTSVVTTNKKDSAASVKKPAATKTSVATKSPSASSANKSIVGTTTKISSSEASSLPASATKKTGAAVLAKTGAVTISTKTPPVSTIKKVPDGTSSGSTTTSAAAIKPITTSSTQASANKSVGLAGSSVPSSTPVLRPSESDKKGGSKSSENNKDSTISKA